MSTTARPSDLTTVAVCNARGDVVGGTFTDAQWDVAQVAAQRHADRDGAAWLVSMSDWKGIRVYGRGVPSRGISGVRS